MSDEPIPGLYRRELTERVRVLEAGGLISAADSAVLLRQLPLLTLRAADRMIENVIGVFGLPFAVAPNFKLNGKTRVVPMVVEEPSIVAGVSSIARLAWAAGGFTTTATEALLVGQIQLLDITDPDAAIEALQAARSELIGIANRQQPRLVARGGGARDIECYKYRLEDGGWSVVLHLLVDTGDAMGANLVNTLCEYLAADVARIGGGKVGLKILSNLADRALVTATVSLPAPLLRRGKLSGESVRDRIVAANEFASLDPYRAATHNKGIMNGIDAVALATGNDWRAIEAGAHAYAARDGAYRALTSWTTTPAGELLGSLTLPLKVGVVGGSQTANPAAALGLRIAGVESAAELAALLAAVGLAQNLAALRALVSDGIQKGHMSLHARSVAAAAGADGAEFDRVVAGMLEAGEVKPWKAAEIIESLRGTAPSQAATNAVHGEAAGKVILLGEHAAVYGKRVLALPLASGVVATVSAGSTETRLAIPDWNFHYRSGDEDTRGVVQILALILAHFGLETQHFNILVRARIPVAMGLGSSAALAVALIRAFDQLSRSGMRDTEVEQLAFECEKISHGTPSGIDNHIATFGRPVLFARNGRCETVALPAGEVPPLVIAASGSRGVTLEQVAGVRARRERNPALFDALFDEIDRASVAGAEALGAGDYEQLGALMNVCHGLLNALGVSTAELENMIGIARDNGAVGAKLTGAGGGGSIVALCPGRVGAVEQALSAAGYQIVTLENRQAANATTNA